LRVRWFSLCCWLSCSSRCFVARALVLALLLVELQLALFLLGLGRLHAAHLLGSGLFGLGGYAKGFLAAFERLVALDVFGLALRLRHYQFGSRGCHPALCHQRYPGGYCRSYYSHGDVGQYYHCIMNVACVLG